MTTPNLQLPEVPQAILTASDELNAGLWILDAVLQLSVLSMTVQSPPANATQGDRYIIPSDATGVWANRKNHIAYLGPTGWRYIVPRPGWRAWLLAGTALIYESNEWHEESGGGGTGSIKQQKATWTRGSGDIAVPVGNVAVYFHQSAKIAGIVIMTEGGPGDCVVDLRLSTFADYPPISGNSICGGNKPTITAGATLLDTTLTGWDLDVAAGDVIVFALESCVGFSTVHVVLLLE